MYKRKAESKLWKYFKRSLGIGLAAEVVFLAGSYAVWHRMNTNSDFRKYIHENFPFALEGYYKVGELLGKGAEIRQLDISQWNRNHSKED
uniref:Uncharacterized protein n=1 Tax=Nyssomyia neivai TaxID=330878 RepID=A0A1L8DD85_9DIPT